MKIKIVKCSDPDWWYSQRIGQIAEVMELEGDTDYHVPINGYLGPVLKTDCEIVEEQKNE